MKLVRESQRAHNIYSRRPMPRDPDTARIVAPTDGVGTLRDRMPGDLVNVNGVSLRIPADPFRDVVERTADGKSHVWSWQGTEYVHGRFEHRWAALWTAAQLAGSTLSPVVWRPHTTDEVIT